MINLSLSLIIDSLLKFEIPVIVSLEKIYLITDINITLLQVKAVVEEKRQGNVIDRRLEDYHVEEINQVFSIAMMCLEPEPSKRPTTSEIVKMLEQVKSYQFVPDLQEMPIA